MASPIYVSDQTFAAILQRLLDSLPASWDKTPGSWAYELCASFAIELAQAAIWMKQNLEKGFAQTTYGPYLDRRAAEHGLERRTAAKASGTVTFTGIAATEIPAGTRVSTASTASTPAAIFETTALGAVGGGGTVDVSVSAVDGGAAGNVGAGAIIFLASSIAGVASITNADSTSGGTAEETDAEFLARYLQRVRNPSSSGNVADYINWALEIAGVGAVSVVPLWNGAGTVKVALLGTDLAPAAAGIVTAVQTYISPNPGTGEGQAPIGATVTVVAATAMVIDVSATLTIAAGYDATAVKAAVTASIDAYLKGLAFATDNDVRWTRVGNAIGDTAGVVDYTSLLIGIHGGAMGTANLVIAATEVAVKGTVTLSP